MARKKRFLSAFLALAMALSLLPASALAAALEEGTVWLGKEERAQYDDWLSDRLGQMLLGDDISLFSTGGFIAGNRLSENTRKYYDAVATKLPDIAANGGSTKFTVSGASSLTKEEASKLFDALCFDFPYEMYWRGLIYSYGSTFSIQVSTDYRSGSDQYAVDPAKAKAASAKVTAADGTVHGILSTAQGLSDLEKLVYFKEEICRLVAYNNAATDWSSYMYGDPWQLVYVFDGDPTTNVVCEGYAKAFQYLCDLSLESAQCYTVSGKMGDDDHMWNIVTLEEQNYLVDVTNCDGFTKTNTGATMKSGYPFSLFLTGASGSPADGYTVEPVTGPFKYLWIEGNDSISADSKQVKQIKYTYDSDTVWHDSDLTLSDAPYPVNFYKITETGLNAGTTYTWTPLLKQGFTFSAVPYSNKFALPTGVNIASDGTLTYKPTSTATGSTEITIKAQYENNEYPYYYTLTLPQVTTDYKATVTPASSNVEYGKSLTVTVNATDSSSQNGKIQLYAGSRCLSSADITGNATTLTYQTQEKAIPAGKNRLTVTYIPADGTQTAILGTVDVTIEPKALTGSVATDITKPYDGSATFNRQPVTLTGVLTGDTVTATADITADSADAGDKNISSATVTLSGKDAAYYAAPETVTGSVAITKIGMTLQDVPEQTVYSEQETKDQTVFLPVLPDGASYGTVTVGDENQNLIDGTPTVSGTTLTFSATSQVAGATATIKITVNGGTNYNGTTITVTVKAIDKQDAMVRFTGTVPKAKKFGDKPFTLNAIASIPGEDGAWTWTSSDRTVLSVEGNANKPGQATVTICGAGKATITAAYESSTTRGSATTAVITINKAPAGVTAPKPANLTYNGQPQALVTAGSVTGGTMQYATEQDGTYGEDIPTRTNAGTYTVYYKVVGGNDYNDTEPKSVRATIKPKPVDDVSIEGATDRTYAGTAFKPEVTVKDGGTVLNTGIDYDVTYGENTNAGTGTVIVTGKGNYTGTKTVEFAIAPKELSGESMDVTGTYAYTGSAIEPAIEVKDGGTVLAVGTDYDVTYADNTDAGTGTVTVTGKGNYAGTATASFAIAKATKPEDVTMAVEIPLAETSGSIPLDLPDVAGSLGTVTYGTVTAASEPEELNATGSIADGALSYAIAGTPADGDKATFTVPVVSQNYEDFQITVEITLLSKRPQAALTVKPDSDTVVYPGTVTLASEGGSGNGAVTYEIVEGGTGSGSIDGDVLTPSKAGTIKVIAKKAGAGIYLDAVSGEVEITVERAPATVRADSKRMTVGEELPALTYAVEPEGVAVTGVDIACEAGAAGKVGTYGITVSGPEVSDDGNYDVAYENGTLTVEAEPVPPHEHAWAKAWSGDGTHHWHECTAPGCGVTANGDKDGYAEHVPGDWIIDKAATSAETGSRHKECAVCGHVMQTESIPVPDHVHAWDADWSSDDSGHWHACACGERADDSPHTPGNWITDRTGNRHKECTVCGYVVQTWTVPATGGGFDRPSRPGGSGTAGTSPAPGTPNQATVKPAVTTKGMTAAAAVSGSMGDDIIAREERDGSGSVVIAPDIWDGAFETSVSIPAATVERIGARTEASLTVSTPVASVTIPNGSLAGIGGSGGEVLVTASVTGKGTGSMTYGVDVLKDGKSISAEQAAGIAFSVPVSVAKQERAELKIKTPAAEVTIPKKAVAGVGRDTGTLGVAVTASAGGTAYDVAVLKDGEPAGALRQPVKISLPVSRQEADAGMFAVLVDRYGNETVMPKSVVSGDGALHMMLDAGSATVALRRGGKTFADAGQISGWAKDAVDFVASRNLFTGTGDGSTFSPGMTMQKAMLVTVLHRLEGKPAPADGTGFADAAPGSWYADAAAWAKEKRIVDGGDRFNGTEDMTRQDLAVMLYRYANAYGTNKGESADISGMDGASGVAEDAVNAMKWAVGAGIVAGSDNGLEPDRAIRREEASVMLMRFVEYLVK